LNPKQAAIIKDLYEYRDRVARSIKPSLFKVISVNTVYAIAVDCPMDLKTLSELPGMNQKQIHRHGKALLQVQPGLQSEPVNPPRHPRLNEKYLARVEALRNWRMENFGDEILSVLDSC